ncbi:MAG: NAD-dependent epimerase/dehydratase family protein [Myxococcota bacterium]
MSARSAFVTGATGFFGRHMVEQLRAAGWEVTVFHRAGSSTAQLARYEPRFAVGTLTDPSSVAAAMPEGVDAVFHVAANTSFWRGDQEQQFQDNVIGTRSVVEAALTKHARCFIHTSSESAWGEPARKPLDEEVPMRGAESFIGYERTKYLAEQEVKAAIPRGLRAVIMNPAHILGRYDEHSWGRSFRLVKARKLPGIPPGSGSWGWAEEIAKAHVAAVDRGVSGENYLLGGVDASYLEVFQEISRLVGVEVPTKTLPAWVLKPYAAAADFASRFTRRAPDVTGELAHMLSDDRPVRSGKAIAALGFRATPIQQILKDCHDWLVAEGRL